MQTIRRAADWIVANWATIAICWTLISAALSALWRAIPEPSRQRLAQRYPRVDAAARVVRKAGLDLIPVVLEGIRLLTGKRLPPIATEDDRPTDPPRPPPATPSAGLLVMMLLVLAGCAATPHQVASAAVSTAGAVTAQLHREHQRVYREATDALRARLTAEHRTLEDYDREVVPLDQEFRRRSDAVVALSAALYASAAVIDATRSGASPEQYAEAARAVIVALDEAVGALGSGAILPAVPIPPEIDTVRATLRGIVAGGSNER